MEFPAIDPVLFQIGPFAVRWYALAYLAGFLLGWRYALKLAGQGGQYNHTVPNADRGAERPNKTDIDDFLIWAIPGVILGGRLGYVLFYNFEYYLSYPLEALMVWKGGMSFHGGVIGMAAAMYFFALKHKFPVLQLSDIIACVAPIGLFFGRIANFINAELYGRVTDGPFGVIFPGTDGAARHPSQLYEAALEGALLFALLAYLAYRGVHKTYPGLLTGLFLALYGVFRFLVEYVREPDAHIGLLFDYISMGQILCLPMIGIGLALIFYAKRKQNVV